MKQAVTVFIKKDNKVLLGLKKTGIGAGKILGIGGKINPGESPLAAAKREMKEEINVDVKDLQYRGEVTFLFPDKPDWDMKVFLFTSIAFEGEPTESAEMSPEWFDIHSLPSEKMWDDEKYWTPQILADKSIKAVITYEGTEKVKDAQVTEIPNSSLIILDDNKSRAVIGSLEVEIDQDLCIGAATCAAIAAKAYGINMDNKAYFLETASEDTEDSIIEGARSCPVLAIKVIKNNETIVG